MALIRCADCGHKVSDLAFACPVCARPVAASVQETKVVGVRSTHISAVRSTPRPSFPELSSPHADAVEAPVPLPPRAEEFREKLRAAREGALKKCGRCGQDVRFDTFRLKERGEYLCAECQDEDIEDQLIVRSKIRRWLLLAFVIVMASSVVYGTLRIASMAWQRTETKRTKT